MSTTRASILTRQSRHLIVYSSLLLEVGGDDGLPEILHACIWLSQKRRNWSYYSAAFHFVDVCAARVEMTKALRIAKALSISSSPLTYLYFHKIIILVEENAFFFLQQSQDTLLLMDIYIFLIFFLNKEGVTSLSITRGPL